MTSSVNVLTRTVANFFETKIAHLAVTKLSDARRTARMFAEFLQTPPRRSRGCLKQGGAHGARSVAASRGRDRGGVRDAARGGCRPSPPRAGATTRAGGGVLALARDFVSPGCRLVRAKHRRRALRDPPRDPGRRERRGALHARRRQWGPHERPRGPGAGARGIARGRDPGCEQTRRRGGARRRTRRGGRGASPRPRTARGPPRAGARRVRFPARRPPPGREPPRSGPRRARRRLREETPRNPRRWRPRRRRRRAAFARTTTTTTRARA